MIYWYFIVNNFGHQDHRYEFVTQLNKTIEITKKIINSNPNDIKALFYLGGSLGYKGQYETLNNKWFKAASYGKKGLQYLKKVIQLDSKMYDSYFGLGLFNYYSGSNPWFIKPILFILGLKGNRSKGIEQLRKVADNGKYAKIEAQIFLAINVYSNQNEWFKGIKLRGSPMFRQK